MTGKRAKAIAMLIEGDKKLKEIASELKISEKTLYNLADMVSHETLLTQLDFIADPKEEAELAEAEATEKAKRRIEEIEGIAAGGGYDR